MRSGEHKSLVGTITIFQMGDISVFKELIRIDLSSSQRTVRTVEFIFNRSLISQVDIEITDTALISPGQNRSQQVGPYPRYITAIGQAIRQPSGIFVDLQMTADIIGCIFRISQNPNLRKIPLRSPGCIGIIKVMGRLAIFQRYLPYTTIVAGISSVYIAGKAASQQGMVKTGIKFHLIFFDRCLYPDASEVVFPLPMSRLFRLVKGKRAGFRITVQTGIFHRGI